MADDERPGPVSFARAKAAWPAFLAEHEQLGRDLAAANARADAAESLHADLCDKAARWRDRIAELEADLERAEAECGRHAIRVAELAEAVADCTAEQEPLKARADAAERLQCTPAERAVLDASAAMVLRETTSSRPPFATKWACYGGGQRCVDAEVARREAAKA